MKSATITILDEINTKISGITTKDLKLVISKIALMTPNGRHTAAYKLGAWDGKEAQLNLDGSTFVYMLKKIIPMLDALEYEFDLVDNRLTTITLQNEHIDRDYLLYAGIELRPHQCNGANSVFDNRNGLLDFATSSGKTLLCATVCKKYDSIGSITIVPSVTLLKQTYADYKKIGLDVSMFAGKNKDVLSKHVVVTWQTITRNKNLFNGFCGVVLVDECHIMGDTMYALLSNELKNAQIRVGLSGTIPTNKWKREKLNCHIGGDVIAKIMPDELIEDKLISPLKISIVPMRHTIQLPDKEWITELAYLNKNPNRIRAISEYIKSLPPVRKRMILVHPEFGQSLADLMLLDFIRDETSQKDRERFFKKFIESNHYSLCASYGTTGTGISINEIEQVILVEVGKNRTRVLQSIGRGLRLDKNNTNKVLSVIDIYTEMFSDVEKKKSHGFSGYPHLRERLKIYKEYSYQYTFEDPVIVS